MAFFTAISSPLVHAAREQEASIETVKITAARVRIQQTKDLTQVAQRAAAVNAGEAGLTEVVLTRANHEGNPPLAATEATLDDEVSHVASAVVNNSARASVPYALTPLDPNVPRDRNAFSHRWMPTITDSLKRASSLLEGHDVRRSLADAEQALSTWVTPRRNLPLRASVEAMPVRAATDGSTPSDASTVAARVFESESCVLLTQTPDFAVVAQRLSEAARATREFFNAHVTAMVLAEGAQEPPVRTDDVDDDQRHSDPLRAVYSEEGRSSAVAPEHVSAASTRSPTADLSHMLDKALLLADDVTEHCRIELDLRAEASRDAERAVAVHSELQAATQRTADALAALANATEAAAAAVEALRTDQAADATTVELDAQGGQQSQNSVGCLELETVSRTEVSAKLDALIADVGAESKESTNRVTAARLTATTREEMTAKAEEETEHAALENDTARLSQEGFSLVPVETNTPRLLNGGHNSTTSVRRKRSREAASEQSSPELTVERGTIHAVHAMARSPARLEAHEAHDTEEVATIRARAVALEAAALTFATPPARAASTTALPFPAADDDAPLSNAELAL